MTTETQLSYELTATIDKFAANFDEATKTANDNFAQMEARGKDAGDRMSESIKSATASIADSFRSLEAPAKTAGDKIGALIGAGLIASAAGIATTIVELINALASAGDRAADLRLPINIIQALSVAADQARVPTQTLTTALDTFTSVSKKSTDGAKKFYESLSNIGPAWQKAFQQAPTQADRLRVIMNALHSTSDEAARANLAMQAFGTDNERLTGIFSAGSGAMEGYIDEVRRLGLEIDESAVQKAQQAKSALNLLSRVMTDELSSALAELIPAFKEFLPLLESVAGAVRDTVSGFAAPENRPLATLKNDAIAAQERLADMQQQLKDLDDYKPATGIVGGIANKFGLDVQTSYDKDGALKGVATDIEGARKKIQDEIASTQSALDQYKKLIAEKQKVEDSQKGHDGGEAPAFKPRPKLNDGSEATSAFDRETNSLNKHIAAMKADEAAIGLTDAAHQRLRAELGLLQAAQKDGDNVTTAEIDAYAKLRQSMSAQQALAAAGINLSQKQAASFSEVTDRMANAATALDKAKQKFQGVNDSLRFAGDEMISVFDKATEKGANFRDIMLSVLKDVEKQLLEAAITGEGAFAKMFGTASTVPGGTGGLMGGLAALFGGARAEGGDVSSGKAYLIGERGPEIMVPKSAGAVIPNHRIAMGSGARNQTVNNHVANVTVNANGGNQSQNQDLAERVGRSVTQSLQSMVGQEMTRQMRNGGIMSTVRR